MRLQLLPLALSLAGIASSDAGGEQPVRNIAIIGRLSQSFNKLEDLDEKQVPVRRAHRQLTISNNTPNPHLPP